MKFDKRNINVSPDYKWPISINRSGYKIIRQGAGLDGERFIEPKNSSELESFEDVSLADVYIEIRKFLFQYEYNEFPIKGFNNLPVLKEKFEGVEDFISADESGFLKIVNKFGLMSQAKKESTEIWLSILKYIALKEDYKVLDDEKIPSINLMTKSEIQLFRSEREQFSKLNNHIKTEIRKDGLHLSPTTLGSALILFALKHNFPQALKCQNQKGNCKKYFIDYSKAQRGEYCSPKCARAQSRFIKETKRQETEIGYIEEILIPKIEQSGWSNSDIKRDYMISNKLKARADIVLTFEDKPLVMIEVKLFNWDNVHSKWMAAKTSENDFESLEDIEMKMQLIRHAREIKAPYAMVCSNKKNYLIDIEKTKSWQEGTFFLMTYDGISEIDSIITPDQARGLEDA
ncbi:MAG: hypothetical protein CBC03_15410 [Pseudoalteromonas sp. TMED43]|nr:MAG: hypothetical protein CBC03_15410 [Pseudoalteromonas sp. TMED43]